MTDELPVLHQLWHLALRSEVFASAWIPRWLAAQFSVVGIAPEISLKMAATSRCKAFHKSPPVKFRGAH